MNSDRAEKRNAKITRTLVRLKYSLQADEEIYDLLEQQKAAIAQGSIPQLSATLEEILSGNPN
jgi:hypothetical protein